MTAVTGDYGQFFGHFKSSYHYQCTKSEVIIFIHWLLTSVYILVLFYLLRVQFCENAAFGTNLHQAMMYVLLLKMIMQYADIQYYEQCPWLESKKLTFYKAFKMTMLTVHNTFMTGVLMHIAFGYKVVRSNLEKWQVVAVCLVTIM